MCLVKWLWQTGKILLRESLRSLMKVLWESALAVISNLWIFLSSLVFGSPVPELEKDQDWTGPRPARTRNHRTAQDRNRSLVCGPLPFREFQDQSRPVF